MEGMFKFSGGRDAFSKRNRILAQSYSCMEEDGFADEILTEEGSVEDEDRLREGR